MQCSYHAVTFMTLRCDTFIEEEHDINFGLLVLLREKAESELMVIINTEMMREKKM